MSLTIKDLRSVYKATFNARGRWKNVLLELGLSSASIKSIGARCNEDADDCYREGLAEWLEGGERSWGDLTEALSSPTVGLEDTAKEIERTKSLQTQVTPFRAPTNPYRQPITGELVIFTDGQLGTGAFGAVFKASFRGIPCAVKVLHNIAMHIQMNLPVGQAKEGATKIFDRECDFLKSFQHQNIVQHLSTEKHPTSGNAILVIELMDCNLRAYFSSLGAEPLSDDTQASLSQDVASGLAYIHSKLVIHRDLCGDNILLKLAEPIPVAKISDFGMSRLLDPSQLSSTLTAMGHRKGYLPPEALRLDEEQYTFSFDVFSFGVVMVQIVLKLETVKSPQERSAYVRLIPNSHILQPIIQECLQEDMNSRPTASQVYDALRFKDPKLASTSFADLSRGLKDLPFRELKPPLALKWTRGEDMPMKMGYTVKSVLIGDTVHVGGGEAGNQDSCTVMKLDIRRQQWTVIPQYNAKYFALTALGDHPVLVGGRDPMTMKRTNQISLLHLEQWIQPFPPTNSTRDCAAAVSFNNHIIVAGGCNDQGSVCSVDIFDVTSRKWYTADPLPNPRIATKSTLIGSTLFLMGGWDHKGVTKVVNLVDLNELIDKAKRDKEDTPTLWRTIESTPLYFSAPLGIVGSLLAVGGCDDKLNPCSTIYLYQPESRSWVEVGELPTARYNCTCSVLSNGQIIVAGGYAGDFLSTVDFLSLGRL